MKRGTGEHELGTAEEELIELCEERQLSTEDRTKVQLVDLLCSNEQKRNNGPRSQGTSSPVAEGPAGEENLRTNSLKRNRKEADRGSSHGQSRLNAPLQQELQTDQWLEQEKLHLERDRVHVKIQQLADQEQQRADQKCQSLYERDECSSKINDSWGAGSLRIGAL